MFRCWITAAVVFAMAGIATASTLSERAETVLRDKMLAKAEVGVVLMRLGGSAADSKVVYQRDATTPRVPASNLKLVTTSAALEVLGSDFKFRTLLLQRGSDLVIVGDGDPSLGDAERVFDQQRHCR
jgi:serine-type D-Ala-D-Ala carboxypeptidase/endopeptidase (penicillin-binding protein 4)